MSEMSAMARRQTLTTLLAGMGGKLTSPMKLRLLLSHRLDGTTRQAHSLPVEDSPLPVTLGDHYQFAPIDSRLRLASIAPQCCKGPSYHNPWSDHSDLFRPRQLLTSPEHRPMRLDHRVFDCFASAWTIRIRSATDCRRRSTCSSTTARRSSLARTPRRRV